MGQVLFYSCATSLFISSTIKARHLGWQVIKEGGRLFFQKSVEDTLSIETRQNPEEIFSCL